MTTPAYKNLTKTIEDNKESDDDHETKAQKFWDAAVNCFNEDIAGDVTIVTGEVIHTPTI